MELSVNERRVLLALSKLKSADEKTLAAETGLNADAAMQAAFMLQQKKFAAIEEGSIKLYSLTDEGRQYAKENLPERQIITYLNLQDSGTPSNVLVGKFTQHKVTIAQGWLKKKEWARLDVPTSMWFSVVKVPPEGEDETILRSLLNKQESEVDNREVASQLEKRKLLKSVERIERKIEITPEGWALATKGISVEEEITDITPEFLKSGAWKDNPKYRSYDVTLPSDKVFAAKKNPYGRLLEQMRLIFLEMGFKEIKDDIVQTSFWNFDALFQPQDHPARDMQDTFYLDEEEALSADFVRKVKAVHESGAGANSTGWGMPWDVSLARKKVLRTHTTALTIRYLAAHKTPPVKVFCIDRVYRRESIDATHLPEFDQLEGIVLDEGVSFCDLMGCLSEFYKKIGFPHARFRPGYFPYTEPSLEVEVFFNGKWIELGGAGIFRQEVTAPLGIKHPVLAWGLGVGRLAMIKLGLKDLRDLYSPDVNWLRTSPISATE
jgi:phenylalanyl-tRNA synthetase alpha chain